LSAIRIVINEVNKGLLVAWHYKFETLLSLLMMSGIFLGIVFFIGGGQFNQDSVAFVLVGYLMWYYATIILSNMSYELIGEAQAGTLEQIFMSPAPISLLLISRSFATLIISTINIAILAIVMIWGLNANIHAGWPGLIVFLITITGLFGFGYIIAGATLVFKRVGTLANVVVNILLFLNGSFLSIEKFPSWLATFAKSLPTTQGIILLRETTLATRTLADLWKDGSLIFLIGQSFLYFCCGLLIFTWCVRNAKKAGTLGSY
jgi:ABC-2 type transport system permease protein